jgi:hypothetical protein
MRLALTVPASVLLGIALVMALGIVLVARHHVEVLPQLVAVLALVSNNVTTLRETAPARHPVSQAKALPVVVSVPQVKHVS